MNEDLEADSTLVQAGRGYRATVASQTIRLVCKAAGVVVMARLVSPAEHGRYAMAATLFFVLVLFRDLGLGTVAIQAPQLSAAERGALWRLHLLLGIALALIGLAGAPLLAAFYHEPGERGLMATMSGAFILIGINGWPRALLARDLKFPELNRAETAGAVVGTIAMIAAGALGAGAYAFAVFLLASEAVIAVGAWRACAQLPHAAPDWAAVRQLWRTSAHLTGYNVAVAVLQQLDVIAMGRWFGATAAGLYNRPAQLLALPNQHLTAPFAQVLLASLSRLGSRSADFAGHVQRTANLIAHLTLPLAALCAAMPDEIVAVLLGAAWPGAAPLLRWLALTAAAGYLAATTFPVCVAAGHSRRLSGIAVASMLVVLAGVWLGRPYGPVGLAGGVALANLALLLPRLWWSSRGSPVRLSDYASAYLGPVLVSVAIAASSKGAVIVASGFPAFARLLAGLAAAVVAAALVALVSGRIRRELTHVWELRRTSDAIESAA